MASSDIVLMPSVSEGFGIVMLEALSVNKTIVAFDVPSPSEILTNGRTGYLVEPYSVQKMASVIDHILCNPDEAKKIAVEANKLLVDKYNLESMLSKTIKFYEGVIAS